MLMKSLYIYQISANFFFKNDELYIYQIIYISNNPCIYFAFHNIGYVFTKIVIYTGKWADLMAFDAD